MRECETRRRACLFRGAALCLTLLFWAIVLFGCGKAVDTGGLAGIWILTDAGDGESWLPRMKSARLGLVLHLDPDGTGSVDNGTLDGRILWAYEEGRVTVETGSVKLEGHPENGKLILKAEGGETTMVFRLAGAGDLADNIDAEQATAVITENDSEAVEAELEIEGEAETEPETSESAVAGDWYGWWKIEDAEGELPVTWYDCCAVFLHELDGVIRMVLWDEDGSRDEPLAEIRFEPGEDGELVSLSGYWLFSEIRRGDWRFTPGKSEIYLADQIHDAGGEHFRYSIYLRPWGDRWRTTLAEQRPFYYDDWYLPLVRKQEPMPDRIPWEALEEARVNPAD